MKSILDIIIEYAGTNERMDSFILDDPHYQELLQKIDTATEKLEKNSSIDEVLSCYNATNAYSMSFSLAFLLVKKRITYKRVLERPFS